MYRSCLNRIFIIILVGQGLFAYSRDKGTDYLDILKSINTLESINSQQVLDSLKSWEQEVLVKGTLLEKCFLYIFLADKQDLSGDITGALQSIKKSQEFSQNYPDDSLAFVLRAHQLFIFGNIGLSTGNNKGALKYLKKVKSLMEEKNQLFFYADVLNNIAMAHFNLGNLDEAFKFSRLALQEVRKQKDTLSLMAEMYNFGVKYMSAKEYSLANAYFDTTLFIARQQGARQYEGQAMLGYADVAFWQDKFDDAERYYKMAISVFKELGMIYDLNYAYLNLSNVYYFKKDMTNAYEYYVLYNELEDSILSIKNAEAISRLQVEFDTKQKEKDLEIAELEIENQQQRNKAVMATRNYLIAGILLVLAIAIGFIKYYHQKQRLARQQATLSNKKIDELIVRQEIKLLDALNDGQDRERQRLARDLHDRMGSLLVALKMSFESAKKTAITFTNDTLDQTSDLINRSIEEVRRISHNLASQSITEFGLMPALKELKKTMEGTNSIKIELYGHGLEDRLPVYVEIEIYRIVQEVIANALKHARASELTLSLSRDKTEFSMVIEDNGKGFDTSKEHEGIGLKNMKARAGRLGAELHFDSSPGRGTTIVLNLNLHQDTEVNLV